VNKRNILSIVLFVFIGNIYAQESDSDTAVVVDQFVKTWRILDKFGAVESIPVDTFFVNFQKINAIDKFSISNSFNGNLCSPLQSKLYFDRPEANPFIFANAYYPYMMQISSATFYNTKTPFSSIKYLSGGTTNNKEDQIAFLFTANANKKLNFGVTLDYIFARGEYDKQNAKRFAGSLFGSYNGKRYSATGLISTNTLNNYENGGITDPSYIIDPPFGYKTLTIPVRMSVDALSTFSQLQFYYNHQYSLGFEKKLKNPKDDKDTTITEFVPVTRFAHTIKYDNLQKRYFEKTLEPKFYKNSYFPIETRDTAALQILTNTFSISLAEEFNKWAKFGLTAYLENEVEKFNFQVDTILNNKFESNTKVGGILSKELGQKFKYKFLGEIDLLGYKVGDFLLSGNVGGFFKLWNDTIALEAKGFIRNDEPSYFLNNYYSNHFKWKNDFSKIFRTHVSGNFSLPKRNLNLNVSVENIGNQIYFNTDTLPAQFAGSVQVIAANLKWDFHVGKFALENNVVYQLSSNQDVIPLPTLALYHNLYFHDKWFDVLSIQLGVDVRYHTAYYAPAYMPAIGQFYTQKEMKIGNYPVLNVYANFHLKRTRFFAEYYHVNQLFMKGVYYSMPYYPINPAIFKMGLTWNFYD
jgi:hypothetical protein